MTQHKQKPHSSRVEREQYFRQADRAWARALTWALQCENGRRAFALVLVARCADLPEAAVWFHSSTETLETIQSSLEQSTCRSVREDRRIAGRVRITCDGIAAVLSHLEEPIDEMLMRRIDHERARGHAWLHRIVIENLPLADFWASRYVRTKANDRDDVTQVARQGLIRASQRFDVERGVQFLTCAQHWCRSFIRLQRDSVRCTVSATRAELRNIRRIHALIQAHGVDGPTSRQAAWLAQELDLSVTEVDRLLILDQSECDLDTPEHGPRDISAPDDTERSAIDAEQTRLCASALATLDERTRKIFQMRFGLGCARPYDAEEIAMQLDLTRERVRQIYNAGLRALRENHQVQSMAMPMAVGA